MGYWVSHCGIMMSQWGAMILKFNNVMSLWSTVLSQWNIMSKFILDCTMKHFDAATQHGGDIMVHRDITVEYYVVTIHK